MCGTHRVEGIRSIADAEFLDRLRGETPARKVFTRLGARGGPQLLLKPNRRHLMKFEQLAALAALRGLLRSQILPLGQGNTALLRHDLDRFREAHILDLLDERENVSRLPAAEAMVKLAHRMDGKRR